MAEGTWDDKKKVVSLPGIKYAVIDEGTGPAVLLLHGMPDSATLWRYQMDALCGAGFRVVAPDLRGCGDTERPSKVDDYKLMKVLGDLSALMRTLGIGRAHVVGHDWGAAVAWTMASLMPRRVDHLVALSVGHPTAYHSPPLSQREKSWYMLFAQFEGVAEELFRRHDWQLFRQLSGGDVEQALTNLSRPGALTAALNWYRANRPPEAELGPPPQLPFILAPTLAIWSSGDNVTVEEVMLDSRMYVSGPWRYERLEDVGHWIPVDAPERLNELLLSFLGSFPTPSPARNRRSY